MKSYGFTLLELLIVIAIAAAFTGILLPQISQFSGSQNLRTEAEKLQAALRGAQTNVASGTRCDATRSANYWRLRFESNKSYKIDSCLDVGEETGFSCDQPCSDLNPVDLTDDVIIATASTNRSFTNPATCNKVTDSIDIEGLGVAFKGVNAAISFFQQLPPDNKLCYFPNDLMISKTFIITLQRTNFPGELINVTVDKGGSIYLSPN